MNIPSLEEIEKAFAEGFEFHERSTHQELCKRIKPLMLKALDKAIGEKKQRAEFSFEEECSSNFITALEFGIKLPCNKKDKIFSMSICPSGVMKDDHFIRTSIPAPVQELIKEISPKLTQWENVICERWIKPVMENIRRAQFTTEFQEQPPIWLGFVFKGFNYREEKPSETEPGNWKVTVSKKK